jgi:hypothetical protein
MRELDGELLVGSNWGNLDDIDAVPMEREFAVVMVGGEVLLEIIAVGMHISSSIYQPMLCDDDKSIIFDGGTIGLVFGAAP